MVIDDIKENKPCISTWYLFLGFILKIFLEIPRLLLSKSLPVDQLILVSKGYLFFYIFYNLIFLLLGLRIYKCGRKNKIVIGFCIYYGYYAINNTLEFLNFIYMLIMNTGLREGFYRILGNYW